MNKNLLRNMQYAVLIALALVVASTFAARAQGPEPTDDDVNRIAKQLYCPVCESTPLDVCPKEACSQWRDLIRQMLSEGKSEAEIKQYFVEHYGARVLDEPPNRLLSYAIPAIAFLIGVFALFRGFQMWIKPSVTEAGVPAKEAESAHPDEYIQKMEEELKKRK